MSSKSFKTLHMPRNITVAQKRAPDFHERDVLAQTNQIKYDCFFCMAQKTQKIFSEDLKVETKILGTFFLDFILLFNIAVEKFGNKIIWSSWSSRRRFF